MATRRAAFPEIELMRILDAAIREDVEGERGRSDLTSDALPLDDVDAVGQLRVKADGVVAGGELVQVTPALPFFSGNNLIIHDGKTIVRDGTPVKAGTVVAEVRGEARALLLLERSLLNLVCRMSGIATLTAEFVNVVKGTDAAICDTRKTAPGLRVADKYGVACGGGVNHRFGLFDEAMIKENHLVLSGLGVADAIKSIRARSRGKRLTCEAENLQQVEEALEAGADCVLLDDFPVKDMAEAVALRKRLKKPRVLFEASGGVTLKTVRRIAETGVERISIGALTHSAPALDLSFKIKRV